MQVDLIRAFEVEAAETETSERSTGSSEFPDVLASSISSEEDRPGTRPEGEAAPSDAESGEEEAQAAAESGAPAGAAAGPAERARELATAESERDAEGRTTDLAARGDAGTAAEDGVETEVAADELDAADDLEATLARAVDGAASGEAEAAGEEVAANARAGAEQGLPSASQSAPDAADVADRGDIAAEHAAEREPNEREQDADARRDADRAQAEARAAEESGFERSAADRAADEAAQVAVDPNLRQQIENQAAAQRAPEVASVDGATAVASPVAGLVTETTPVAPGMPTPVVASEAIAVQTEWLATRGGGSARLVLHPPELGEMAIRVTLRAGAVDVVMVAQEAMAAGVAEEQAERLAQAFAGRDLRLDQFDVRRGDPDALDLNADGRFAESGSGDEREARGDETDRQGDRGRPGSRGDGAAPTPVPRIATIVADTGGVDLRI